MVVSSNVFIGLNFSFCIHKVHSLAIFRIRAFCANYCTPVHHIGSAICFQGANWTYYDNFSAFQCLACAEGCDDCVDASPCIVSLNMVLRSILLVLQCVIIGKTSHGFRIIKEKLAIGAVENYFSYGIHT
jgi:hypothetical protein